ncbi:hypothetical protein M405DRAFT_128792 [Rhizopogon salebrosus TDB-379]|nr:hypothetical protein M405DRAFT_128792 [Rhizopogon salebrosus TDB-379]
MAHLSPGVNLIWAIMTVMLESFLIYHLWSFDRFKCVKWNRGPYSGAFKRVMTYSYLTAVPLIMIYALGFAIIKYSYGYTVIPGMGIVPTPYELWSGSAQSAVLPLYLIFSIAWGLEMVNHLEELCFWLFVINSGSAQRDWFRSLYFKTWAFGSGIAVIYMPLVTIFTRQDPYKCEAYTFLAGGLGSLSLTLWFLPILWAFPAFLESLEQAEVDTSTMVRLTKFHELNCIRIFFRFLFTVSLVILGIDGVRPHQHINDKMFPTDLLAMIASIGFVVSSGITLVIFFPRSIKGEMTNREAARERKGSAVLPESSQSHIFGEDPMKFSHGGVTASAGGLPMIEEMGGETPPHDDQSNRSPSVILQPNRRTKDGDVELGNVLTDAALTRHNTMLRSNVNHLVHNWRSPLEIGDPPYWYR